VKITIIGSTGYRERIKNHAKQMTWAGHIVKIPAFDDKYGFDELQLCEYNRGLIEWADEVHIIWDCRSVGTIFDFGMVFALHKPIKLIYLEKKTIAGVMKKYEEKISGKRERI